VLGFSFKPNTDDLRESPHVALVEALIGKGKQVKVFDPHIQYSRLMGANRRFIDAAVPHVIDLLANSVDEVLDSCDCIVVANRDPLYESALDRIRPGQVVIDLVRIRGSAVSEGAYQGLSW
jgi:GDP-mannose 6-dehydrogenase